MHYLLMEDWSALFYMQIILPLVVSLLLSRIHLTLCYFIYQVNNHHMIGITQDLIIQTELIKSMLVYHKLFSIGSFKAKVVIGSLVHVIQDTKLFDTDLNSLWI